MSLYTGQYLYLDDSGHRADTIIKIIFKNGNEWSILLSLETPVYKKAVILERVTPENKNKITITPYEQLK